MFRKNSRHRLIMFALIFSLISSMFTGVAVNADDLSEEESGLPETMIGLESDETPEETTEPEASAEPARHLTIDYLGKGNSPSATAVPKDLTEDDINTEFWIGVSVNNIDTLSLITSGVYTLEIGFDYDPKVVEPYSDDSTDWKMGLEQGNINSGADNTDPIWWSGNYEVIEALTAAEIVSDPGREEQSAASEHKTDGWKMCFANITAQDPTAGLRFAETQDKEKQYLIRIPFKLKSIPAETENQVVLNLSRGPTTFVIGSGNDGTSPHAAWNSDSQDEDTNIKLMFDWDGDINLFDDSPPEENAGISGITVSSDSVTYDIYKDSGLTDKGFAAETLDYYTVVPNEAGSVTITLDSESETAPTVTYNNTEVSPQSCEGGYTLEITDLLEITPGESDSKFSKNVVVIVLGDSKYTVYIERLIKPKIELNAGNSPYGMIERMGAKYKSENSWTDAQIKAVKERLMDSTVTGTSRYKFSDTITYTYTDDDGIEQTVTNAAALPDGASTNIIYQPGAWGKSFDKTVNLDMDEEALFIYQRTAFKDPGFTAYDEEGNPIDTTKEGITVTVKALGIRRMNGNSMTDLETKDNYNETVTLNDDGTISDLTSSGKKLIRPGIYELEYTVNGATSEPITKTRKLILLANRCDIDLNGDINSNDKTIIREYYNEVKTDDDLFNGLDEKVKNLYFYRIFDVDLNGDVNSNDGTIISEIYNEVNKDGEPNIYVMFD